MMNEIVLCGVGFLMYAIGVTVWAIQGRIELKRQREELRKALSGHYEEAVKNES